MLRKKVLKTVNASVEKEAVMSVDVSSINISSNDFKELMDKKFLEKPNSKDDIQTYINDIKKLKNSKSIPFAYFDIEDGNLQMYAIDPKVGKEKYKTKGAGTSPVLSYKGGGKGNKGSTAAGKGKGREGGEGAQEAGVPCWGGRVQLRARPRGAPARAPAPRGESRSRFPRSQKRCPSRPSIST